VFIIKTSGPSCLKRSLTLINRVLQLPDNEAKNVLLQVYNEFSGRYEDIQAIFDKHFELIKQRSMVSMQ